MRFFAVAAAALIGQVAIGCAHAPPPAVPAATAARTGGGAGGTATGREAAGAAATGRFRFVEAAGPAGLTRVLLAGRPDKDHLLDSAGSGAAFLDYDGDGRLDVYLLNGWRLDGSRVVERGRNALYRNRGDGSFEDVTDRAGAGGEGEWGAAVAVADYDADGHPDILIANFGRNVLYRNRGDGRFENVAARLGVEAPGWNTAASFLDADGDGDLDLYIAAYIEATLDDLLRARPTLDWKGLEKVAVGPFGLTGARDHFFRFEDGRFVDRTVASGLEDRARGFGFAVRAADYDDDGDLDLYIANDSDPNYLYRNDGSGRFTEVGVWSGCALDANGAAQAGMGVATGDVDGDGATDILVTNFSEDYSTLYHGLGGGLFDDVSEVSGIGPATYRPLSWGAALADLDADGDLDLVIANGHIYPQIDRHPGVLGGYAQRNMLLENRGGRFVDVTADAGPGFAQVAPSRGLAVGDYDNDGDLDLLITNLDGPPSLLRNDGPQGAWLMVDCVVPGGPAPPIGTMVTVSAGGRTWRRDIASGDSYASSHDPRLHFGLGTAAVADSVEVRWPDGTRTLRRAVGTRRLITIRKGE